MTTGIPGHNEKPILREHKQEPRCRWCGAKNPAWRVFYADGEKFCSECATPEQTDRLAFSMGAGVGAAVEGSGTIEVAPKCKRCGVEDDGENLAPFEYEPGFVCQDCATPEEKANYCNICETITNHSTANCPLPIVAG